MPSRIVAAPAGVRFGEAPISRTLSATHSARDLPPAEALPGPRDRRLGGDHHAPHPGHNDSDAELGELSAWIRSELGPQVPLHFSASHPDFKMLDVPATPPATLTRARKIALGNGLRYVYTGNVHDAAGDTTRCHACGEPIVRRDWYELKGWNLTDEGACGSCGEACAGRFDGPPGSWGRRRQPVRLGDF